MGGRQIDGLHYIADCFHAAVDINGTGLSVAVADGEFALRYAIAAVQIGQLGI